MLLRDPRLWKSFLSLIVIGLCFAFLQFGKVDESSKLVSQEVFLPAQASLEWSSTRDMSSDENAEHHFEKHGEEFGFENKQLYLKAANDFVSRPPEGTLTIKQKDGDKVFYHPDKNWFAVVSYKGQIRTFYRLDPKIHGYKSNTEYFNAQARRK